MEPIHLEPIVVPLHSRALERAEKGMSLVDAVSALNLGFAARDRLGAGGGAAALGFLELAVSVALLVAAVLVVTGRASFGRWISALAGVVLMLEGMSRMYGPRGHASWALTLNGVALLAVAIAAPWLEKRRRARRFLRLDDDGAQYRRNRLRFWRVSRADVVYCAIGTDEAVFHTTRGRTFRVDLADLHNRDEASAALRSWAAAHGIPGDEPHPGKNIDGLELPGARGGGGDARAVAGVGEANRRDV
jgi:hypothetical protein